MDASIGNGVVTARSNTKGVLARRFFIVALFAACLFISADLLPAQQPVRVYLFWGSGCPHCAGEIAFLKEIKQKYPHLEVKTYEVWYNKKNADFFLEMSTAYGITPKSVPVTFIGEFPPMIGYRSDTVHGRILEERIRYCMERGCIDPAQNIASSGQVTHAQAEEDAEVTIPFFGKVDATRLALPVLTLIIAGMDGFNPCAFFVLFLLLSLLVYAESRKKILLIGGTFVFFSGLIYFLFMAAWLNIFLVMGQVRIITTAAGAVAILIAAVNIKDFFLFRKGVSLTIPEKAKPRLFQRMRNLLKAPSLASMMLGTVVLAVAANTYELLCTAGFPMVYTRILTLRDLPGLQNYLYLGLYNLIYVLPLAGIVAVFAITLGTKKMSEWQGRVLKLISGIMMLCLGLLLLLDPDLLSNVAVSAGLLACALALAGVIVLVYKRRRTLQEAEEITLHKH